MAQPTPKTILETIFEGNISKAARATGISRQTWHKWKRRDDTETPPSLRAWLDRLANIGTPAGNLTPAGGAVEAGGCAPPVHVGPASAASVGILAASASDAHPNQSEAVGT